MRTISPLCAKLIRISVIVSMFSSFSLSAFESAVCDEGTGAALDLSTDYCKRPKQGPTGATGFGATGPTGATGSFGINGVTGGIPKVGATIALTNFGASGPSGTPISATGPAPAIPFNTSITGFGGAIGNVGSGTGPLIPHSIIVPDSGFYYVHFVTSNFNFADGEVQLALGPTGASGPILSTLPVNSTFETPVVLQDIVHLNAGDQLSVLVVSGEIDYQQPSEPDINQAVLTIFELAHF